MAPLQESDTLYAELQSDNANELYAVVETGTVTLYAVGVTSV